MLHISRAERNFTIAFLIFYVLAAVMSILVQLTDYITGLSSVMYSFFIIGLPVLTLDAASCVGKSERMKTPASVKVLWGAAILLMLGYLKLKGDINTDAEVDAKDMARLKRYLADDVKYSLSAAQLQIADVNGDGTADAKDMAKLKRYLADEVKYPL